MYIVKGLVNVSVTCAWLSPISSHIPADQLNDVRKNAVLLRRLAYLSASQITLTPGIYTLDFHLSSPFDISPPLGI